MKSEELAAAFHGGGARIRASPNQGAGNDFWNDLACVGHGQMGAGDGGAGKSSVPFGLAAGGDNVGSGRCQ